VSAYALTNDYTTEAAVCALAIVCCGRPKGRLRPKLPGGDGRPQESPV